MMMYNFVLTFVSVKRNNGIVIQEFANENNGTLSQSINIPFTLNIQCRISVPQIKQQFSLNYCYNSKLTTCQFGFSPKLDIVASQLNQI